MKEAKSHRIFSDIVINASPDKVWMVFGDFKSWGKWNDFMVFRGEPKRGKRCTVTFLHKGCIGSTFWPKVRGRS